MLFFNFFSLGAILLTIYANPLPSDSTYSDFYSSSDQLLGPTDSLFGDKALTDSSLDGLSWEEPSQNTYDAENLWASTPGDLGHDLLPPDDPEQVPWDQGLTDLANSGASCGGEIQKRGEIHSRDGEICAPKDAPLNFKIPTLPQLLPPKTPTIHEYKPTLGRLRLGFPPVEQNPYCEIEPYELHFCCDGPLGDEAPDFGDLSVYTPVKNCYPGKFLIQMCCVLIVVGSCIDDRM